MTVKQTASETESSNKKPSKDKDKSKIKFENKLPRDEAVAYFEKIIESLKAGALSLTQGEQTVELSPGDVVEFEVKASKKGSSEKVSFELEWQTEAKILDISSASSS